MLSAFFRHFPLLPGSNRCLQFRSRTLAYPLVQFSGSTSGLRRFFHKALQGGQSCETVCSLLFCVSLYRVTDDGKNGVYVLLHLQGTGPVPPACVLQLSAVGSMVTICFGQEDLMRSYAAGIFADELRFINQKFGIAVYPRECGGTASITARLSVTIFPP